MTILVLGAGGLLGSHFCKKYPKETIGLTKEQLDIRDIEKFRKYVLDLHPDVVVNCAEVTSKAP